MQRLSHALAKVALLLAALPGLAAEEVAPYHWEGVQRIVAVGDLHGDYGNYLRVLREAGILDRRDRWDAGETHLVQLGDIPDRGPDTAKIIEHLQKLEKQATRAGGRVHVLIGNHDAMNIIGDLRYVHPGEYAALATRRAQALLEDYWQRVVAFRTSKDPAYVVTDADREAWFAEHPPGFIEHRQHWHPDGEFGRWTLEHPTVLRINDTLFVHGGLSPAVAGLSLESINTRMRDELSDLAQAPRPLFAEQEDGPLWYRGLAATDGGATDAEVMAVLEAFGARRIVVGHTPGFGTVMPRFDGRVLVADTGIAAVYGGFVASVLIEGEDAYTVQGGAKIALPTQDSALLPYLQDVAAVLPAPAENLTRMIAILQTGETPEPEASGS